MKKWVFINVAALLSATALLCGSVVYAASKVETAAEAPDGAYDGLFTQESELGIADLIGNSDLTYLTSSAVSSNGESAASVSSPSSLLTSSKASSKPASSQPKPSSKPSSTPSSSIPSSQPVSSQVSPPSSSSEESSSEEVSMELGDSDYADILDAVAGAVQREIVGTNTAPRPQYYEAYKAQAVACHTYMEYYRQHNGGYPTMSYSTPNPKTVELVNEVLDELMYYNGSVINASYHAASGGHTQSASAVWGSNVPYMIGVESAYDEYERTFTISAEEAEDKLASAGIFVSGDPGSWFDLDGASYTDGDFVSVIYVCGTPVKCRTLRESIFGANKLMSTKIIDVTYDGANLVFTTRGYGHGAGMSQLGALGYSANEGWDYRTILEHYYTGITIE